MNIIMSIFKAFLITYMILVVLSVICYITFVKNAIEDPEDTINIPEKELNKIETDKTADV